MDDRAILDLIKHVNTRNMRHLDDTLTLLDEPHDLTVVALGTMQGMLHAISNLLGSAGSPYPLYRNLPPVLRAHVCMTLCIRALFPEATADDLNSVQAQSDVLAAYRELRDARYENSTSRVAPPARRGAGRRRPKGG